MPIIKLQAAKSAYQMKNDQIIDIIKYYTKVVMYQQRIISYSFTCVIFFLIGASLGSIIRKGGMGLPVIIAIVIFILFYVINLMTEKHSMERRNESIFGYMAAQHDLTSVRGMDDL